MKKKFFFILIIVITILILCCGIAYAAFSSGTVFETQMQMPPELQSLM